MFSFSPLIPFLTFCFSFETAINLEEQDCKLPLFEPACTVNFIGQCWGIVGEFRHDSELLAITVMVFKASSCNYLISSLWSINLLLSWSSVSLLPLVISSELPCSSPASLHPPPWTWFGHNLKFSGEKSSAFHGVVTREAYSYPT